MPVDHDRKFVFVHIPKTAGTSILCSLFGVGVDEHEFIDSSCLSPSEQRRRMIGDDGNFRRLHHYPLQRIALEQPLESYFVFAFVRNPFDRLVSEYHFLRLQRSMPFADFVMHVVRMVFEREKTQDWFSFHFLPQVDFLTIDGKIACDFLGRFESLERDYRTLCERLQVDYRPLATHKKSVRSAYRDYYDASSRAVVDTYYRRDLEAFGYSF
jgi:chondroitin 4-sulfotransferase 11